MAQLELAQSLGYIDDIKDVEELAIEISRMLTSLIKKYRPFSNWSVVRVNATKTGSL